MQNVAVGADHAGFDLKQTLVEHLRSRGVTIDDCGTHSAERVDYPRIVAEVGTRVSNGRAQFGVIVDGTG